MREMVAAVINICILQQLLLGRCARFSKFIIFQILQTAIRRQVLLCPALNWMKNQHWNKIIKVFVANINLKTLNNLKSLFIFMQWIFEVWKKQLSFKTIIFRLISVGFVVRNGFYCKRLIFLNILLFPFSHKSVNHFAEKRISNYFSCPNV